jgi:magnesium chelatase family protein
MQLTDICASYHAKRAIEVALAGMHSIIFIGPWESEAGKLYTWLKLRDIHPAADFTAPCPCGYYGCPDKKCTCSIEMVADWRRDHLGPRHPFDIHIEVPINTPDEVMGWLDEKRRGEPQEAMLKRVKAAREFASEHNLQLTLDDAGLALLKAAVSQLRLSYSQAQQAIKVARTIANLAQSQTIQCAYLAEAIQYRPRL